jgi:hypothetical protein
MSEIFLFMMMITKALIVIYFLMISVIDTFNIMSMKFLLLSNIWYSIPLVLLVIIIPF